MNRLIVLLTLIFLVGCGKAEVVESKEATVEVKAVTPTSGKIREKESVQAKYKSLGVFKLTAYCSCSECCGIWAECRPNGVVYGASGEELAPNHSVAVDTSVIPYGTVLLINGIEYVAQDCGGGVIGNHIDIYFDDHEEAVIFGEQYAEVFIEVKTDEKTTQAVY